MSPFEKLKALRDSGGTPITTGLPEDVVKTWLSKDQSLVQAVNESHEIFLQLKTQSPELVTKDEATQIHEAQSNFINFYPDDAISPFVALAARGPWIITSKGAVIHDSGGYGMLGLGHAPQAVLDVIAKPYVMANIMTPSFAHHAFATALRREIGQKRKACPYTKFLCLNSGSESVSLAGRFADINTKLMTDPGAAHAGWTVKRIAVKGAFHGRTELPVAYSDSSRKTYAQHLASYKQAEAQLITIEPYDVAQLHAVFAQAQREQWHIEAMFLEPVMGEGDPGRAVPPEFYAAARELTKQHETLLLVDSIQAGMRAHGYLSIVDYPGFEDLEAPDMETYSKALSAGQYPLSVLAVNARTAKLYRKGVYGNTMTSNPRAMDIARTVLEQLTPELRTNIQQRGKEFVEKLQKLAQELPNYITKVQGTGLLVSCELATEFKCYGAHSTEEYMRQNGIGVIHGGVNSLRFTPPFAISSEEIDLIVEGLKQALIRGPRLQKATNQAAA
jgi:4-aminobutyrate aminotransferase-like enzyme